jgi:hypothetical protein
MCSPGLEPDVADRFAKASRCSCFAEQLGPPPTQILFA